MTFITRKLIENFSLKMSYKNSCINFDAFYRQHGSFFLQNEDAQNQKRLTLNLLVRVDPDLCLLYNGILKNLELMWFLLLLIIFVNWMFSILIMFSEGL